MSWYRRSKRTWLESFCIKVLSNGPIPRHVAIILDGNRRYATKIGLPKIQGHPIGFEKLTETLGWCLDLGIREVTVYIFSIENFKRSEEEVKCLMDLAHEKFKELIQDRDRLAEYGVRVRVLGNITLLPEDLQKLVAETVLSTRNYNKAYLNICIAYTSRDEITNAVKEIAEGVTSGKLETSDITEDLLSSSLYSSDCTTPDVLIRTSGEVRLSDFLLWQCSYTPLAFLNVLWPEFTIWHLFAAVLYYQHSYSKLKALRPKYYDEDEILKEHECLQRPADFSTTTTLEDRRNMFLVDLKDKRQQLLRDIMDSKTEQNKTCNCWDVSV